MKRLVALLSAAILAVSPVQGQLSWVYASDDVVEVTDGDAADAGSQDTGGQDTTLQGDEYEAAPAGEDSGTAVNQPSDTGTAGTDTNLYADDDNGGEVPLNSASAGEPEAVTDSRSEMVVAAESDTDESESYTVTYDPNGGSWDEDGTDSDSRTAAIKKGNPADYYGNPVRKGFAVAGWSTDRNAEEPEITALWQYVPTGDVTLYAVWKEAWTVTLDPNGGSWDEDGTDSDSRTAAIKKGNPADYYGNPVRKGFAVAGWSTERNAEEPEITALWQYVPTGDVTLYAVWTEAWTVTLDPNGGSWPGNLTDTEPSAIAIAKGDRLYFGYLLYRKGYAVVGWSTDKDAQEPEFSNQGNYVPTGDVTLYAVWKEAWTMTCDPNGGYWYGNVTETDPLSFAVAKGKSYDDNLQPDQNGSAIVGWSTDRNAEEPEITDLSQYVPTGDVTLYAVWKEAWTVTLDPNGGYWGEESKTGTIPFTVAKGDTASRYFHPDRSGLAFAGWSTDRNAKEPDIKDLKTFVPASDVTLYAVWKDAWTITFYPNYETDNDPYVVEVMKGCSVGDDLANRRAKENCICIGWSTDPNATEPEIKAEELIDYIPASDMSLYAVLKEGWKIYFDPTGGSWSMDDNKEADYIYRGVLKGDTIGEPPTPYRKGYSLAGWSIDFNNFIAKTPEISADEAASYIPTKDLYLLATWTLDTEKEPKVEYQTHVQSIGWQNLVSDGETAGTTGQALQLEAIRIKVEGGSSGGVKYQTLVQQDGWNNWVSDGADSGTVGQSKHLEAIRIRLKDDLEKQYDVYYRVRAEHFGWMDWAKDGEAAGTSGYSYCLEGIQIRLVKKGGEAPGSTATPYRSMPTVSYQTHVQSQGWQEEVSNGAVSGTVGKSLRLEGIKIRTSGSDVSGGITYKTHVQTYGWQNWVTDDALSGTTGESKRLEAIQIKLTGELANEFDVYYRVHAQHFGWMGWAKNGASAGTAGYSYRLEGIQIQIVPKGGKAPGSTATPYRAMPKIYYQTHVQKQGWQAEVSSGAISGTVGQSLRLEGIKIRTSGSDVSGGITYKTHVQTYGWQRWVADGALSGTIGQSKRLEAIQMKLTGALANEFDVYYRVHAQHFGWMGWAKNGASAGTAGYAYRLEGIQIQLVPKGQSAPSGGGRAFRQK